MERREATFNGMEVKTLGDSQKYRYQGVCKLNRSHVLPRLDRGQDVSNGKVARPGWGNLPDTQRSKDPQRPEA